MLDFPLPKLPQKVAALIRSLKIKKYRTTHQLFLVEGEKLVLQVLHQSLYPLECVVVTASFAEQYNQLLSKLSIPYYVADAPQLSQLGNLTNNHAALAVLKCSANLPITLPPHAYGLIVDSINDPSNLGALLRVAGWYGFSKIVCSTHTVDLYNPKVIQSSMGAFLNVQVYYTPLKPFFQENTLPIIGTFLKGDNVHTFDFPPGGWILLGSEAHGIAAEWEPFITYRVAIPGYESGVESLNVACAAAVVCDAVRRKI